MFIRLAIGPVAILSAILLLLPLLSHAGALHAKQASTPSYARSCEHAERLCAVDPGNVCCL